MRPQALFESSRRGRAGARPGGWAGAATSDTGGTAVVTGHLLAKGVTRTPAVAQLDELADGEVLDVPGSPRVVHAPGHTAGSCALLLWNRSLLFSGDALVTLDMTQGRTGPQVIRGPVTEDAELAVQSLDTLAATNAQTVLPGHGEPWPHGVESAVDIARQT